MAHFGRTARVGVMLALLGALALPAATASAHGTSDTIRLYTPLRNGSVSTLWGYPGDWGTIPLKHHIVYTNWGYRNDWSVDVYAPPGRIIVSPFASKTSTGHATRVTVVGRRAACASGAIADGGYRVTLEAKDAVTGAVIGRADLAHVANPQVGVGQVVGPWTTIGTTSRYRWNGCYQVSNDRGVHTHLEIINLHRYACYVSRSPGSGVNELTVIGLVGRHDASTRAC